MPSVSQSVLSTQFLMVPVTTRSPSPYNPTADLVQFAFPPLTIPATSPAVWYTGSWVTFPGPSYWAECLVGPVNGGVPLAAGSYQVWVKITDSPEVPALLCPTTLVITSP